MHKPALVPLLYRRLFPTPRPTDPASFETFITRNLIPEVRAETTRFYGPIETPEAQYPGLDYTNNAHRMRLSAFPWHRRLFRALDDLKLTQREILSICRWEGTAWAREVFENRRGEKIGDSTFDDITIYYSRPPTAILSEISTETSLHQEVMSDEGNVSEVEDEDEEMDNSDGEIDEEEQESEDELQASVGVELNQRLLAATEARARGEEVVLDAAWEQWLKDAAERDEIPIFPPLMRVGPNRQTTQTSSQRSQAAPEVFRYGPGNLPLTQVDPLRAQMPPPSFLPHSLSEAVLDAAAVPAPAGTAM